MLKVKGNPEPLSGYNDRAYVWMLHEEFNKLKARLLNLAETAATNEQQSEALKGLVKDFTNQAYYESLRKIEDFLSFFKVIDGRVDGVPPNLEAQNLKDLHVN